MLLYAETRGAGARQRAIEDAAGVKRGTLDPNMQS